MWRLAHIVPLYKGKGDKSCLSSYRPISLTFVVSKLLERIVANWMKTFWLSNNLIWIEQHGFIPYWSTVTNLVTYDTKIANMFNKYNVCDVFLIDFARAVDKVPHSAISYKTWNYRALAINLVSGWSIYCAAEVNVYCTEM